MIAVATTATIILAVAIVVFRARVASTDSQLERAGSTAAPPATATTRLEAIAQTSDTSVGSISWTRVQGDAASVPSLIMGPIDHTVGAVSEAILIGGDESGRHWQSTDGGLTWARDDVFDVERRIGDDIWSVRHERDRTGLSINTVSGFASVDPDIGLDPSANGFSVDTRVVTADGFPIALDGDAYLLATHRAGLAWDDIVGDQYRVAAQVDDLSVAVASSNDRGVPITKVTVTADDDGGDGSYAVVDASGGTLWAFDVGDIADAGRDADWPTAVDVVTGASISAWLRWNGAEFVPAPVPWGLRDRVDVAAMPGGVLARQLTAQDLTSHVWRSADGRKWTAVDLPKSPLAGTPITIHEGDGEAIVTAFTDDGATSWSTRDGVRFVELPDVSGITGRTHGSFGWVAPDARSAPRFRVSGDGADWQLVDLRDLLGLEASQWGVSIDVRAIDSTIYVTVDEPGRRTLLIGDVEP